MDFSKKHHAIGDIGDKNIILNGDGTINIYNEKKVLCESMLFRVLDKITDLIENTYVIPNQNDDSPYEITDKIAYNQIDCYERDLEIYDDGMCCVSMRLRDIELNFDGSIREKLFKYVNSIFRDIRNRNPSYSATELVCSVEDKIKEQLKNYNQQPILSPEDLTYVEHIVYYVFASCRIFKKPPQAFIDRENVNSE